MIIPLNNILFKICMQQKSCNLFFTKKLFFFFFWRKKEINQKLLFQYRFYVNIFLHNFFFSYRYIYIYFAFMSLKKVILILQNTDCFFLHKTLQLTIFNKADLNKFPLKQTYFSITSNVLNFLCYIFTLQKFSILRERRLEKTKKRILLCYNTWITAYPLLQIPSDVIH